MEKLALWQFLIEACAETLKDELGQDDYNAILELTEYAPHENSLLRDLIFTVVDEYIDFYDIADHINSALKPVTIYPSTIQNQTIGELLDILEGAANTQPFSNQLGDVKVSQKTFSKILVDGYNSDLPTVIFDLDDTLGDMHVHLIGHANETYGLSETSERWQSEFSFVKLAEKCGVDTDTFYQVLKEDLRPVQKFKVNEHAVEFINAVRKQFELETESKVNIHVVTSRGNFWLDHSDLILQTVKTLPIDGVHVIDLSTCKATWSTEKFNVIAMFEDSPRHIEACVKARVPVFISSMDYNRHYNMARFSLRENDFGCFS